MDCWPFLHSYFFSAKTHPKEFFDAGQLNQMKDRLKVGEGEHHVVGFDPFRDDRPGIGRLADNTCSLNLFCLRTPHVSYPH